MKNLILIMLAALFTLVAEDAFAESLGVRTVYGSTPVGTTSWVQLVAASPSSSVSISVFDSSGQTLELGIGAAGKEVRAILIPPGGVDVGLQITTGVRISIRAVSATASVGENDFNLFY